MTPSTRAIHFYHEHLGQHLAPDAAPSDSVAPSMPTRTKKSREARAADPTAPLDIRRVGTGMPVFYIVTEDHAWFLSNAELADNPAVTSVRIDNDDGKVAISGTQYIAHWLYHDAPLDRPFLIGSIEKANPTPSLRLSMPPMTVYFCTTSGKTGTLCIHLADYRHDIAIIKESGIPWKDVKKALAIQKGLAKTVAKEAAPGGRDGFSLQRQEDALRKDMKQLQKKHPGVLNTLRSLQVMADSPNAKFMEWFFANDNVYGQRA
ncbi:MAG: hypothetical protein ACTHXU_12660 [Halomonas sp.]|uniref:hypothetical protein n=1 Tax=Halomonas casei TaxID=2742613 RepID=UPI003CE671D4